MPKPPSTIETQVIPTPENDRRQRRRWSAAEKKRIVDAAAACEARGELGEFLRREGIYSSHLHNWRRSLEQHGMNGLEAKRPGPKLTQTQEELEIAKLTRKNAQLVAQLELANKVIELQKKAHEILGIALPSFDDDSSNSSSSATPVSRSHSRAEP